MAVAFAHLHIRMHYLGTIFFESECSSDDAKKFSVDRTRRVLPWAVALRWFLVRLNSWAMVVAAMLAVVSLSMFSCSRIKLCRTPCMEGRTRGLGSG